MKSRSLEEIEKQIDENLLTRIDKSTTNFPLIGKLPLEIRLLIFTTIILIAIVTPLVILAIPSKLEMLTENSWCVDNLYYKRQELTPNSTGLKLSSEYDNCLETMDFRSNGIVTLPGVDSHGVWCRWEFRNDSLIISRFNIDKDSKNKIKPTGTGKIIKESIFHGKYSLEIRNNMIKMQSKDLTIIGKIHRFNFPYL